ncbi:uncharacterized protein GIQ15_06408 [Arthroderma uncinatum]|uniref:uncharacterized protein n=1 Tax=Arthroderma uncinatum TaxID=74035 RepID=UPI00144AAB63|nr:uncharacterized protein GIQ15_06408 [Arthroderma uncinatum]KAF3479432.1 hypothetical protein GIQ15_06408 [Arthroderma uncinatum]
MGPPNTASRPQSNISAIVRSIINISKALVINAYTALYASFNAVLPQQKRAEIRADLTAFARARPILASFLASQTFFCGIPIFLFVIQTISVLIFSFTTALVLASICAITFTAICTGLALLVLVPVLALTAFAGVSVWCWGWVGWWALVSFGFVQTGPPPKRGGAVRSEENMPIGRERPVDGFNGIKVQKDAIPTS